MTSRGHDVIVGSRTRRAGGGRWVPAALVALGFVAAVALHATGRRYLAQEAMLIVGVRPAPIVFLDADMVMSGLRCVRQGVDVFAQNPCDFLGRLYDYSPLWLHLAVLPFTTAWIVPVGIGLAAMFVAALCLLPPVPRRWQVVAVSAAAVSPPVVYALERGNNELVIFSLASVLAALSVGRMPWRMVGLACGFLAGLLKYFPMVLMAFALRERLRAFLLITAASVAGLAAFVWGERETLGRALALVPEGDFFGDWFGARVLASGLAQYFGLPAWVARAGQASCLLASVAVGARVAARGRLATDLNALSPRALASLLAGALLILGCFCTAMDIGYRAIHLVLAVPAAAALAGERRMWRVHLGVLLGLLWAEAGRHWVDAALLGQAPWRWTEWLDEPGRVQLVAWLVREALWWWVVTLLWGVVFVTGSRARAVVQAMDWVTRRQATREA